MVGQIESLMAEKKQADGRVRLQAKQISELAQKLDAAYIADSYIVCA